MYFFDTPNNARIEILRNLTKILKFLRNAENMAMQRANIILTFDQRDSRTIHTFQLCNLPWEA